MSELAALEVLPSGAHVRQIVKQLVPPVLATALRGMQPGPEQRKLLRRVRGLRRTNSSYRVDFTRIESGSEIYFVPRYARQRPACIEILAGRHYEPMTHDLVRDLLRERPGDLVHAGTFFGDMLPSFSRNCPGIVYAFEPVLENYLLARLCIEVNNLSNVLLWHAGLGRSLSIAHVDTGEEAGVHNGGASQIGRRGQNTSLLPLDAFGLTDVSVLHLDVEGYELEALNGAAKTIAACGPTVLVEDNSRNCAPFLTALDYKPVGQVPGLTIWSKAGSRARAGAAIEVVL